MIIPSRWSKPSVVSSNINRYLLKLFDRFRFGLILTSAHILIIMSTMSFNYPVTAAPSNHNVDELQALLSPQSIKASVAQEFVQKVKEITKS